MVIIYVGKKVPDYYEEISSTHLGKGIWMFSCELKPDWEIRMKSKRKTKKPNKVQTFFMNLHDSSEADGDDFIKKMIQTQKRKPNKKEKKLIEAMK